MLGNASRSPKLTLVQAAMGGEGNCVSPAVELGSSSTYWLWQSQQMAGKVAVRAVRGLGSRGSKCVQGKDGEGRRWQELQVAGQRLRGEQEGCRRGVDVVLGK